MSVIIEGFCKPKNCCSCPFNNSNCFCNLTDGGYIDRDDWSCSAECPIKELPKGYGRLIDEKEIDTVVNGVFNVFDTYSPETFLDVIHNQCIETVGSDRSESEDK